MGHLELFSFGKRTEDCGCEKLFDGGVIAECNAQIINKVGSAYVIQIAEKIEESSEKMKVENNC